MRNPRSRGEIMKKVLLGVSALALISIATVVAAQTPDQPSAGAATPTAAATASAPAASASPTVGGTSLRLAEADTSVWSFRRLDTDNDGRISALEAAQNPRIAAAFTKADKDKDGYLSREEFESLSSPSTTGPDVAASSPSGDRASDPSGDQPATGPNDTEPATDTSQSSRTIARRRK
jgi:hypothetical protein